MPVPGPTKIQGTHDLGMRIPPSTSPTGISEPKSDGSGNIIPSCSRASHLVHTPYRGLLRFVLYFKIATHKWISFGCIWVNSNPKQNTLRLEAIENRLGFMAGNTSRTYSSGISRELQKSAN